MMIVHDQIYVNGKWIKSTASESIDVVSAITEQVIGRVPEGTPADVDLAVAAAKAAFPAWNNCEPAERQRLMYRLVDELKKRADDLATVIVEEVGQPISQALRPQVNGPISNMGLFADLLDAFEFEHAVGEHLVVREGVGVVGCITPWNVPLNQIISKTGGAFAAGCTVVLKPSEVAPLNGYIFAEAVDAAGFPPGVFNLVSGYGPTVGAAITDHPDVDMVSFTGSTGAGKLVAAAAAESVKQVGLELGGKSAFIILDDADFSEAIRYGVRDCFKNSGQICVALTRMLVPESRYEEALEQIKTVAESYVLGDPREEGNHLGPLISQVQWDRVQAFIKTAEEEGGRLLVGGAGKPDHLLTGYFTKPTVFVDVTPNMTLAREEVFGPVLAVMPYKNEAHAIEIANDSVYGLSGGVWSSSLDRAQAVARKLRTGTVLINGGRFNYTLPLSGYKSSGIGRENGVYGIEEFLLTKSFSYGPKR